MLRLLVIFRVLQRLYSTFANGLPGRGLFLLRLAVFVFLIQQFVAPGSVLGVNRWEAAVASIAGALLLAGLWTPLSAALTALLELWIAISVGEARDAHLMAAAIALSLVGLGPGAWSIDARLFGRRRISMRDR